MTELLVQLPVWRVILLADREVQRFPRRLGFEFSDDEGLLPKLPRLQQR